MVVRCPPPPHKNLKTNTQRKALLPLCLVKERPHKGIGWRALLGQVPTRGGVQNAFTGDSMARLPSKSSMMMGMVTGAAHR